MNNSGDVGESEINGHIHETKRCYYVDVHKGNGQILR